MTIRVSLAKAFVTLSEKATDVADTLLRSEAQKAYDKLDNRLGNALASVAMARQRIRAAERRSFEEFHANLNSLNAKLEDHSYAIPAGKSPDA